jgi:hypothetical protein
VDKEHKYERLVRRLQEWIEYTANEIQQSLMVDDRPMFFKELTEDQALVAWKEPRTRLMMLEGILKMKGPEAMQKFKAGMEKKYGQYTADIVTATSQAPEVPYG